MSVKTYSHFGIWNGTEGTKNKTKKKAHHRRLAISLAIPSSMCLPKACFTLCDFNGLLKKSYYLSHCMRFFFPIKYFEIL